MRFADSSVINLSEIIIDEGVACLIPASLAERHQIIPIRKEGSTIILAMADPSNIFAMDDVRIFTRCNVEPLQAAESEIARSIKQAYGLKKLAGKVNPFQPERISQERKTAENAPAVDIVNFLITKALQERASDIHVEPLENHVRVRLRIDGILRDIMSFPHTGLSAVVSRIKIMGEMDITEKRLPQDGRAEIVEQGRQVDLRISTMPTIGGEKVAIRLLDKESSFLQLQSIGFSPKNLAAFRSLCFQSYGMVIVTGPTGSGKTTTLYSALNELNTVEKNLITIEDPIEYRLAGINQIQVNHKIGLTFATGLRSILRQDPNVVMVGEIRDLETAQIAVRAALTGQLVFATLHTNDAPGAIIRLVDIGVEPYLVSSSVLGVVAQRLLRIICRHCKTSYIQEADSLEYAFLGEEHNGRGEFFKGTGCVHCGQTGYKGRMAIQEVMTITAPLRTLINRKVSTDELAAMAKNEGMITMRQDGIEKACQGLTTLAEVMRVASSSV